MTDSSLSKSYNIAISIERKEKQKNGIHKREPRTYRERKATFTGHISQELSDNHDENKCDDHRYLPKSKLAKVAPATCFLYTLLAHRIKLLIISLCRNTQQGLVLI